MILKVTVQNLGDIKIFRCTGRIVYGSEGQLMTALSRQNSLRVAVIDLAGVRMIDAAGLRSLTVISKQYKAMGIRCRLLTVLRRAVELLMLTNLRCVLEVCSVPEMLDLLCRARNQPAKVRSRPKRRPLKVLHDAGLFSLQA